MKVPTNQTHNYLITVSMKKLIPPFSLWPLLKNTYVIFVDHSYSITYFVRDVTVVRRVTNMHKFFPQQQQKKSMKQGYGTQLFFKTYLDNLLRIWIVQMCTFYFCDTFVSTVVFRKPEKKKIKYFQLSEIQNIASQNECLWNGRNVKKGKIKTQLSKKKLAQNGKE